MIQHTPFVRKLTYTIGFTSIILGVLLIIFLLVYKTWFIPEIIPCNQWLEEIILPEELSGTITSVTPQSPSCKKSIQLDSGQEILYCTCDSIYSKQEILPGMTFHKPPNSLSITICFSPDSCATYQFPCCD